jgi:ribosome-binding protein aMBF1 (putative translation factor)
MNSLTDIKKLQKKLKDAISFKNDDEIIDFNASILSLEFTDLIEELMKNNDINKAQLARKLKTSKSYITQLFSGDKLINLKLLARIQRIFKVKFVVGTNSFPSKSQQYKKFKENKYDNLRVADTNQKKVK